MFYFVVGKRTAPFVTEQVCQIFFPLENLGLDYFGKGWLDLFKLIAGQNAPLKLNLTQTEMLK